MSRWVLFPKSIERQYDLARIATVVFLAGLYALGAGGRYGTPHNSLYLGMILLLFADWVALNILARGFGVEYGRALLYVLPVDLVAVAMTVSLLHGWEDAFFPVCVLVPVTTALIVSRREAITVSFGTAVAYIVGHLIVHGLTPVGGVILALKAVAIPFIGMMVASTVAAQRAKQAEVESSKAKLAEANDTLRRRMTELQAVSQITEVVHSTLDFDRVGPVVIEIVAKVIGVDACCLFVIDKDKSETLFSASLGSMVGTRTAADLTTDYFDDHFSCMPVLDHASSMVLFCAGADHIEALSEADRILLSAVASELVVAVENSRLYKLTKKLAITDELTSLYNYRYLQQRLDEEIERARRYDKHLSLLMIDVDDFKGFNDKHGHIAGDHALSDLGEVMRQSVREVDVVARYGGEEFSIVLPETDGAGAYIVAEKVREAVGLHMFADEDGARVQSMTVSIGVASYPAHAHDKECLLREADDALYRAKNGGKNRVRTPLRPREQGESCAPSDRTDPRTEQ